jgi:hypothetical protein
VAEADQERAVSDGEGGGVRRTKKYKPCRPPYDRRDTDNHTDYGSCGASSWGDGWRSYWQFARTPKGFDDFGVAPCPDCNPRSPHYVEPPPPPRPLAAMRIHHTASPLRRRTLTGSARRRSATPEPRSGR